MNLALRSVLTAAVSLFTMIPLYAEARIDASSQEQQRSRPRSVRPNITFEDTVGPQLVIPVVGSLQGNNGTFFKSAVTIMNFRGGGTGTVQPQRIKVEFLERGVNSGNQTPTFTVLNQLGVYFDDFLAGFFSPAKSGLGAVIITAVDAQGNLDPNGLLDAVSRVYTAQATSTGCPQPGGSSSQSLSSFPIDDLEAGVETGYIYGLRQDASFRTNLGIVNHDTAKHTFNVRILKFNGQPEVNFTIDVEGKSMSQVAIPAGDYGLSMYVEITTEATGFFFNAYGTSVDNATGDGWVFKANY